MRFSPLLVPALLSACAGGPTPHPELGIAFDAPSGWTLERRTEDELSFRGDEWTCNVKRFPFAIPLEQLRSFLISQQASDEGLESVETSDETIGGVRALRASFLVKYDETKRSLVYVLEGAGDSFAIAYVGPAASYDEALLAASARSFRALGETVGGDG